MFQNIFTRNLTLTFKLINPFHVIGLFPLVYYLHKINNRNTRCEICSMLTIKIAERLQWRRSSIFIVNFVHISHLVLLFLLLTLNMSLPTGHRLFYRWNRNDQLRSRGQDKKNSIKLQIEPNSIWNIVKKIALNHYFLKWLILSFFD